MTLFNRDGIKKAVATYLVIGSTALLIYFFIQKGLAGLLHGLVPSVITVAVLLFYLFSGLKGLLRPSSRAAVSLVCTSLLLQSVSFSVNGLFFRNYFGPVAGIEFSDSNRSPVGLLFQTYAFAYANGFEEGVQQLLVVVNFLPVCMAILILKGGKANQ